MPPDTRFVAPLGSAVKRLIHAPKPVQSAGIGRIGVIDDIVLEHESAEAWPLAHKSHRLSAGARGALEHAGRKRRRGHRVAAAAIIVFAAAIALLLFGDGNVEIVVESPSEDAQGKLQPMRRLNACSFGSGARDAAHSITS